MLSKYVAKIRHKVRKKKFLKEIRVSREQGFMTDWLAMKFVEMAENYGNRDTFVNYPFIEDAKAHAVMQLTTSWTKFNPDRFDNAHAYFTTVVSCAFAYYLNKEKTQGDVKAALEIELDDGNSN